MKVKQKEARSSKWAFLLYEESIPKNFIQKLDGKHVPYILSPLHNLDVNPETGELKKAHWHGCLFFESLKSQSQVSELLADLNGPKYVEVVHSPKGMYDYFVHAENPDKTPYKAEDIKSGCGFDLERFLREQDKGEFIVTILDIIENNNIIEFRELVSFVRNNDIKLLEPLYSGTFFFTKYLDSRRNAMRYNDK